MHNKFVRILAAILSGIFAGILGVIGDPNIEIVSLVPIVFVAIISSVVVGLTLPLFDEWFAGTKDPNDKRAEGR